MTQDATKDQQPAQPQRYELRNRYVFDGKLEMKTGLHIGGGKLTLSYTDSPVVLTEEGFPFIPGSSFKGSLRSTIEKVVASFPDDLGLHTCGLPAKDMLREKCPTARQQRLRNARNVDMEEERKKLCHTCRLFGSPFAAARITVNDLYLIDDEWSGRTQIRDGVAIDRDSETAKSGAKYDYEVVPPTTVFGLHMVIENATEEDLQLISIGLGEFMSGEGGVGGLRSRGLGACKLAEDLQIRYLKLDDTNDGTERKRRLQRYLLLREKAFTPVEDVPAFFQEHINKLFGDMAATQ
jgi:CRISPR-associated RAMP protein (TIGR02581 family)